MTARKKRPRDANQLARSIVDIATGEVEDRAPTPEEQGKDPAAVSLGRPHREHRSLGGADAARASELLRRLGRHPSQC
jgi:hypothetical protein